jgi:hypothetical protein
MSVLALFIWRSAGARRPSRKFIAGISTIEYTAGRADARVVFKAESKLAKPLRCAACAGGLQIRAGLDKRPHRARHGTSISRVPVFYPGPQAVWEEPECAGSLAVDGDVFNTLEFDR